MRAIMADNDIQGHMRIMTLLLESNPWREFWIDLGLSIRTFADLSLDVEVADDVLWHTCQREQIVLVTGNRNKESPDSLEATIESHNSPTSLPVLTLSDPNRLVVSRAYANRVVEAMLQYLLDIDSFRGTPALAAVTDDVNLGNRGNPLPPRWIAFFAISRIRLAGHDITRHAETLRCDEPAR